DDPEEQRCDQGELDNGLSVLFAGRTPPSGATLVSAARPLRSLASPGRGRCAPGQPLLALGRPALVELLPRRQTTGVLRLASLGGEHQRRSMLDVRLSFVARPIEPLERAAPDLGAGGVLAGGQDGETAPHRPRADAPAAVLGVEGVDVGVPGPHASQILNRNVELPGEVLSLAACR